MCWDVEERHHPQEAEKLACPKSTAKQVVVSSPALGHEEVPVGRGLRKSSTGQTLEQDLDIPDSPASKWFRVARGPQREVSGPCVSWRSFQGVGEVKTILIMILRHITTKKPETTQMSSNC